MTYFSHIPLQTAIYSVLTADATLDGLISGIYDHVPDDAEYPFVTIGEHGVRDWSNAEKQGTEQQVTLRVFSRDAGRKAAGTIMEQLITLMHNASLSVSGHSVVHVRFVSSNIVLLDDGRTYRGAVNFRVLLSAN